MWNRRFWDWNPWPMDPKASVLPTTPERLTIIGVIFHHPARGGAISQPICNNFGEFVDLTDVITPLVPKYSLVFPDREMEKSNFRLESKRPIRSAMRYRASLWCGQVVPSSGSGTWKCTFTELGTSSWNDIGRCINRVGHSEAWSWTYCGRQDGHILELCLFVA